jgi:hypothetical protein
MNSNHKIIKIFLASPGDVKDERSIAIDVLSNFPYDPFLRNKISIEVVAWDKLGGPPMEANLKPQEAIIKGLPLPKDCDIFIAIFWSRIGTPLEINNVQYLSGTHYEYCNAKESNTKNGSPRLLVYRREESLFLNPDDPCFNEKLDQYNKLKIFFEEFNDSQTGEIIGGYNSYSDLNMFEKNFEIHVKTIIKEFLENKSLIDEDVRNSNVDLEYSANFNNIWNKSPFPGLRAFTPEDEPIYFGRSREVNLLVQKVREENFITVVGASGSGKSSLIGAGLIPRILNTTTKGSWIPIMFTPDNIGINNPFGSLAAAFIREFPKLNLKKLKININASPKLLEILFEEITNFLDVIEPNLLLIIDQFEELFTTINPIHLIPFVEMLSEAVKIKRIKIVITIRGDFYYRCVEIPQLAILLEKGTFPLSVPGVGDIYDMIVRPSAKANLEFEEGLPQRIINDTGTDPGALALMAYTLDELYLKCKSNGILSHEKYESIGCVSGAIGNRAEEVFNSLNNSQKCALNKVFRELVEVDDRGIATRKREKLSNVALDEFSKKLINELTNARLLIQTKGNDNLPVLEVAHEALLTSWSRLAEWIEITQDDLRLLRQVKQAALEWENNNRSDTYLWPHERLVPVYKMQINLDVSFDKNLNEFVRPEIDRLLEEWNSSSKRVHRKLNIIDRFAEIGNSTSPILIDALSIHNSENIRINAARALGKMKEKKCDFRIDSEY